VAPIAEAVKEAGPTPRTETPRPRPEARPKSRPVTRPETRPAARPVPDEKERMPVRESSPPVPPAAPAESGWVQQLRGELDRCKANIFCREQARWKYCDGHWNSVPECKLNN
ncbi:MAG: hypothetical protein WBI41_03030, partial [Azovibrio sp.]